MLSINLMFTCLVVVSGIRQINATSSTCSYSESLEDRLQAIEGEISKMKCETGTFGAISWPAPTFPIKGEVKFQTTFDEPPGVTYGIYVLDADHGANLRVKVTVNKTTKTGFTYTIESWNNTKLYGAKVSWMACPTRNK